MGSAQRVSTIDGHLRRPRKRGGAGRDYGCASVKSEKLQGRNIRHTGHQLGEDGDIQRVAEVNHVV